MPRSYKSGADGVVSSAGLRRRAELTTPSATNRNGSIVFDVADTPPLRGGECAARKTLSKKLKITASFHKSGADGVVSSAGLGRRAELTAPSATNRNGSIVFDVADTPPLRGGECAARKTLSKKLKLTASFHKS